MRKTTRNISTIRKNAGSFYNLKEYDFINDLYIKKKYLYVIKYGLDYISKYPRDFKIYAIISMSYIMLGDYITAREYLDYYKYYAEYKTSPTYYSIMINLFLHENNYIECERFISNNYSFIAKNDNLLKRVRLLSYFLRKKLGIENEFQLDYDNKYFASQIESYSYEKFLNHIRRHIIDEFNYIEGQSYFNRNVDINKLMDLVRKNLHKTNNYITKWAIRNYCFKYDNCGTVNRCSCNYFIVAAIEDTDQFITIYPVIKNYIDNYVDLTLLMEDNPKVSKVKRLSQIEKFNKRYSK